MSVFYSTMGTCFVIWGALTIFNVTEITPQMFYGAVLVLAGAIVSELPFSRALIKKDKSDQEHPHIV